MASTILPIISGGKLDSSGRYTGKRMRRRPASRGNGPAFIDFDSMFEEFYADYTKHGKGGLEKAKNELKKEVIGFWSSILNPSTTPREQTYDPQTQRFGEEEIQDIAAVQTSINLNPKDIFTDTKRWLEDNAWGAVESVTGKIENKSLPGLIWEVPKAIVNSTDFQTYAERDMFDYILAGGKTDASWENAAASWLFAGSAVPDYQLTGFDKEPEKYKYAFTTKLESLSEPGPDNKPKPLVDTTATVEATGTPNVQVVENVPKREVVIKTNSFDDLANKTKNFLGKVESDGARAGATESTFFNGIKAVSWELRNFAESGELDLSDPEQAKALGRLRTFYRTNEAFRMLNLLTGKNDFDVLLDPRVDPENITDGFHEGIEKGMRYGLGNITQHAQEFAYAENYNSIVNFNKKLDSLVGGENSIVAKMRSRLDKLEAAIGKEDPEALRFFKQDTKPLRDLISQVSDLGLAPLLKDKLGNEARKGLSDEDIANILKSLSPEEISEAKKQAKNLIGQVNSLLEGYSNNNPIPFLRGKKITAYENFIRRELLNQESLVAQIIRDHPALAGSKHAQLVLEEVLRAYVKEDIAGLVKQLDKEGLIGVLTGIGIARLRKRINGFAPSVMVKQWLDEVQYFGLIYSPNYAADSDVNALHFADGGAPKASIRFGNWLVNESPISRFLANNQVIQFSHDGKSFSLNIRGHRSLEVALELHNRVEGKVDDALALDMEGFFALINGKVGGKYFYQKGFKPGINSNDTEWIKTAEALREWLKKYAPQLGIDINTLIDAQGNIIATEENFKLLRSLFASIAAREANSNYVSILYDKAGMLQKVSSKLNLLQNRIYKSKVFQFLSIKKKAISAVSRRITREAVKWITKALAKLAAQGVAIATEGIGEIIAPLIERAVTFIIQTVVNTVEKVFKKIKKSGTNLIDSIDTLITDTGTALMKGLTWGCFTCGCITLGPVMIVMMVIIVAISPVSISRMAVPLGGSGGFDPGPGTSCTACCGPNTAPENCPAGTPSCSTPPVISECEISKAVGCFVFTDKKDWKDPNAYDTIERAAINLKDNYGCYVDKLCAKAGTITVKWDSSVACGWTSGNTISFGNKDTDGDGNPNCWNYASDQNSFNYLFAHETGHIYDEKDTAFMDCVDNAVLNLDGDFLKTYAGDTTCSREDKWEDYADTIGVRVYPRCGGYSSAPKHEDCAAQVFACSGP